MTTFKWCRDCAIAEEVPATQRACPHCGGERLRPATPREVLSNLPFLLQRASRSAEEEATYQRALAFTEGCRSTEHAAVEPDDGLSFDDRLAYTQDLYREMRGEAPHRNWSKR